MASRLNFGTGAIVNPLEGLQQAVTSVGGVFDKYVQREQDREDRLARESEDRRRYETQLGRYDRQEQESLRRYEEGKELNKLEREEMRKRYEIADARQAAADKRAEKDQLWQDQERNRLSKERDEANKFATGALTLAGAAKEDAAGIARGQIVDRYMHEAEKDAAAKGKRLVGDIKLGESIDPTLQGASYIPLEKEQEARAGLEAAASRVGQTAILNDPTYKARIAEQLRTQGVTPTAERINAIAAEGLTGRLTDAQVAERDKEYFNQLARITGLTSGKQETKDENGNVISVSSGTSSKPKSTAELRANLGNDVLGVVKGVFGDTDKTSWLGLVDSDGKNMTQSLQEVVKFAQDPKANKDPRVAKAAITQMITDAYIAGEPLGSMSTDKRLNQFENVYNTVASQVASGQRTLESDRDVLLDKLNSAMVKPYENAERSARSLLTQLSKPVATSATVPGIATAPTNAEIAANQSNRLPQEPVVNTSAGISPTQLQLAPKDAVGVLQQVKSNPELDAMNSALADAGVAPSRRLVLLKQAVDSNDYSRVHQALSGRLTPQEQANKEAKTLLRNSYNSLDAAIVDPAVQYVRRLGDLVPTTSTIPNLNELVRQGNQGLAQ